MVSVPESNLFILKLDLDPIQDWRLLERTDQRPSVSRFIPLGHDEPRVLIHLLSQFFLNMASSLHSLSITSTERSAAPKDQPQSGPCCWSGRPLVTPQLFHGRYGIDGHSFFGGAAGRSRPHTGDHTSCTVLNRLHSSFCRRHVFW